MSQLKTIGRVETISILDLELFDLDAKLIQELTQILFTVMIYLWTKITSYILNY